MWLATDSKVAARLPTIAGDVYRDPPVHVEVEVDQAGVMAIYVQIGIRTILPGSRPMEDDGK